MADEGEIFRTRGIGKFLEARLGDGARHLAGAVGAEVEEDHGVIVANQAATERRLAGRGARW